MEYTMEQQYWGRKQPKKSYLKEFEDAQSMFDSIVKTCSWVKRSEETYDSRTFSGKQNASILNLAPLSSEKYIYSDFFDTPNIIEYGDYLEKEYGKLELMITDDEGNRVDINSLTELVNLEGVDHTGVIVREGRRVGGDGINQHYKILYGDPIIKNKY